LARKAFSSYEDALDISVASNGEVAMDMLQCKGEYKNLLAPDLILLDINLPRKDGRQVLAEIKQDSRLNDIPVVVLTGSEGEKDILESSGLVVSDYIVKPFTGEEILRLLDIARCS